MADFDTKRVGTAGISRPWLIIVEANMGSDGTARQLKIDVL
jgi:hypothetical protein